MMLEVSNLHSGYGRIPILHGIDFSLDRNEYLGILGHNGMGKSTLMRALMGHLSIGTGSVKFDGRDITLIPIHERSKLGLGYVPQGREIFPNLSVFDNLRMGLASHSKENLSAIEEVLEEFPRLRKLLDRRGGALSGGEQQLLALARCVCTKPRLILLDEPTEGIQPNILDEIVDTLQRLKQKIGVSMILVEQNLEFISALSDRLLTIQKGEITGEISGEEIKDHDRLVERVGVLVR